MGPCLLHSCTQFIQGMPARSGLARGARHSPDLLVLRMQAPAPATEAAGVLALHTVVARGRAPLPLHLRSHSYASKPSQASTQGPAPNPDRPGHPRI